MIWGEELNTFGFIGELSLNAELRAVSGVLPMVIEAKNKGIMNVVVPKSNLREQYYSCSFLYV